jgi:hypothetical protein
MWKKTVGADAVRDREEGIAWWSSRRDTMSKTKQPDVAFEQFEQAGPDTRMLASRVLMAVP